MWTPLDILSLESWLLLATTVVLIRYAECVWITRIYFVCESLTRALGLVKNCAAPQQVRCYLQIAPSFHHSLRLRADMHKGRNLLFVYWLCRLKQ